MQSYLYFAKAVCIILSMSDTFLQYSVIIRVMLYQLRSSISALHDNLRLEVFLAKLRWATAFILAEKAVEVAERVDSAAIAYLADAVRRVHKLSGSHAKAHLHDVVAKRLAGAELEEAAERRRRHAHEVSKFGKANLLSEVLADIVLHL